MSDPIHDEIKKLILTQVQRRAGYSVVERGAEMQREAEFIDVSFDAFIRRSIERSHVQYGLRCERRQSGDSR